MLSFYCLALLVIFSCPSYCYCYCCAWSPFGWSLLASSGIVPKPFEGRIRSVIINHENKQNIESFNLKPARSCCSRHGYKIMITITITKNNVYEKICDPPDSSCWWLPRRCSCLGRSRPPTWAGINNHTMVKMIYIYNVEVSLCHVFSSFFLKIFLKFCLIFK